MSPEEVIEYLRAVRPRIGEIPLTVEERRYLQFRTRQSDPVLHASISAADAHEMVSQAIGQPAGTVRQMQADADRWATVEDELRGMLAGVSGANLVRRQRIAFLAAQAATIGARLARDPANSILVPYVEEIRRLKSIARRKRRATSEE